MDHRIKVHYTTVKPHFAIKIGLGWQQVSIFCDSVEFAIQSLQAVTPMVDLTQFKYVRVVGCEQFVCGVKAAIHDHIAKRATAAKLPTITLPVDAPEYIPSPTTPQPKFPYGVIGDRR